MADAWPKPGQEFWFVATNVQVSDGDAKSRLLQKLSSNPALNKSRQGEVWQLKVPDGEDSGITFGSFDNLVRLSDDLQKADGQIDGIVHRMERQWLEVAPNADFKVKVRNEGGGGGDRWQHLSFKDYITNWKWDEGKYPKSRSIATNLEHLVKTITRTDDEARNQTMAYNESKAQHLNIASKEGGNLLSRDLVDVLTPNNVSMKGSSNDDLIYSEYLTTVVVILPRGAEKDFVKQYESFSEHVVPGSHKKFGTLLDKDGKGTQVNPDKDGNTIWRVVVMKAGVEEFKKACREKRLVPRDFEYSPDGYKSIAVQRDNVWYQTVERKRKIADLYASVWSDSMSALLHIKAMRLFVESVLRYGLPPSFAAFAIAPTGGHVAARKALKDIIGAKSEHDEKAVGVGDEGEEYFNYVSFSFTPFTLPRDSQKDIQEFERLAANEKQAFDTMTKALAAGSR